jgi:hypothetical protein
MSTAINAEQGIPTCSAAQAMEKGLLRMAAIPHGGIDMLRLVRITAGALCEVSLDSVEDPAEFMQQALQMLWHEACLDGTDRALAQERQEDGKDQIYNMNDPRLVDREVETGRLLVRTIQMDYGAPSETLYTPLIQFAAHVILSATATSVDRSAMALFIEKLAQEALAYELATQELCDLLIETKIADHDWSLGDAICALAGSAAQRLAIKRAGRGWNWETAYQTIADVMMREALSLGVPPSAGWEFGMAANDSRPNPPIALIRAVESSCMVFLDLIGISAYETQSVVLAKAAGRMLALAATGEEPEIEAHIAKPLACHAMAETLRSFM